jgi:hypothetical protein
MRPVPIRHRGAVGCFVKKLDDRGDQGLKIILLAGDGGRPDNPVELGVFAAVVQRQTVGILNRAVVGHFLLGHGGGENIQIQQPVPDEIVLLAPGAGFVKGQAIVVAVIGHLHPLFGISFSGTAVSGCDGLVTHLVGHAGIAPMATIALTED